MPSNLSFNFDQLISFVTVAEKGTISRAASALGKDRSTIHQHISNLEIDLNLQLFHRQGKSTSLTKSGELLLPKARHLIYSAQHMEGFSASLGKEECDRLTVYCDNSVPSSLILKAHQALLAEYPYTRINWIHKQRDEMMHAIATDQADMGIGLVPGKILLPSSGIDFFNMGHLRFTLYTGKNSDLAKMKKCSLTELANHVEYVPESYLTVNMFKTSEFSMHRVVIGQTELLYSLLANTEGWAILPEHMVKNSAYSDRLCQINADFASDFRWSYAIYSKNLHAGTIQKRLIEHLKQGFASIS